jgi:16S rRNA (cytidine1402-2'-O)-methyltransferase
MPGTLYIVATPIGNLEDITLRALKVLSEVDIIACEDTRHTRKLLSHYEISKPLVSYYEHNERERAAELVARLESGSSVALVSDAGMPLISDPGYHLVREAIEHQIPIVPIPGASALVTALAASGLDTNEFLFAGFLPSRKSARRARLSDLAASRCTLVFYETPHRIAEALRDALEVLGDRPAALARELTKIHEEIVRGRLSDIIARVSGREPKGEYVLMIGPSGAEDSAAVKQDRDPSRTIKEEIDELMNYAGMDKKTALKRIAKLRGISKSEAYRMLMSELGKRPPG